MVKKSKWTYNKSAVVTLPDGTKESFATQLYKVGVYIIWNGDAGSQGNIEPVDLEKMCKKIKKDLDAGKLTDVQWGSEITVTQKEHVLLVEVE